MQAVKLISTANNTKWDELRLAMHGMTEPPTFRCKDLSGNYSPSDREWFYHFRSGGYETMRYVDVLTNTDFQRAGVLSALKRIGLAGHEIDGGFRIYGYAEPGQELSCF